MLVQLNKCLLLVTELIRDSKGKRIFKENKTGMEKDGKERESERDKASNTVQEPVCHKSTAVIFQCQTKKKTIDSFVFLR